MTTTKQAEIQARLLKNIENQKNGVGATTGKNPAKALEEFEAKHNLQPITTIVNEDVSDIQAAQPKVTEDVSIYNTIGNYFTFAYEVAVNLAGLNDDHADNS
jgi:hypothetical protein